MKTSIKTIATITTSAATDSIRVWAGKLAIVGKTLTEAAKPYQVAYKSADVKGQHTLRVEWRIGYLMSLLDYDEVRAIQVATMPQKGRTKAQTNVVDNAKHQFATYVSCTSQRATKATAPKNQVAIPRALKSSLAALIEAYGADVVRAALKASAAK